MDNNEEVGKDFRIKFEIILLDPPFSKASKPESRSFNTIKS